MLLGDIVDLGGGLTGTIVAVIDDAAYADGFPKEEWEYLGIGALLEASGFGLVHYPATDHDFTLVRRAT
ncbi:hypothetical protein EGJ34_05410 [Stenotrophomonas sp. 278]|nr:hypothetical protein EGJ34_05410 [Stenotrophomonas sp. 278]